MVTKIQAEMIGGSAGAVEVGDFTWSARTSKASWLLCQGQAVSRAVYTAPFLTIGTANAVISEDESYGSRSVYVRQIKCHVAGVATDPAHVNVEWRYP